MNSHTRATW